MEILAELIHVLLWILAFVTTIFPITYMIMAPWSKSWLGRGVVILGWALAALADLTLLFHHWEPPIIIGQLITIAVFLAIIAGSVTKTTAVIVLQVRAYRSRTWDAATRASIEDLGRKLKGE